MSFTEMTEVGIEDALTYLIENLATQFGPLGEESRLQATRELFECSKRRNEATDALLARLHTLRFQTTHNGGAA
eukprot:9364753-Pyramimonas_sp.AAC.1